VYSPDAFREQRAVQISQLLAEHPLATLISINADAPVISHIPLLFEPGSGEHPLTLDEYRASYAGETHSLEASPSLDASDQYKPLAGSPCLNAGDPSVYKNATKVNIGLWPFFLPDSK